MSYKPSKFPAAWEKINVKYLKNRTALAMGDLVAKIHSVENRIDEEQDEKKKKKLIAEHTSLERTSKTLQAEWTLVVSTIKTIHAHRATLLKVFD